jgi:hypothetical protein
MRCFCVESTSHGLTGVVADAIQVFESRVCSSGRGAGALPHVFAVVWPGVGHRPGWAQRIADLKPRPVRYASFVGLAWPRQLRRLSELARFKVFKNINF